MRSPFLKRRPLLAIALASTLASASAIALTVLSFGPSLLVGWFGDQEIHPSLGFIAQHMTDEALVAMKSIRPYAWITSPILAAKVVVAHVLVDWTRLTCFTASRSW